ncbi:hypothetical protein JOE21_000958 [Desmospora profundinema]|uniref:Uncharacterized protein n=1 Tax=Desmospora profundinema TaxID=1571184 RepID=A0ABU1IJL5_9BACL|nr:hypothetical protein [Desmospora profundinema]
MIRALSGNLFFREKKGGLVWLAKSLCTHRVQVSPGSLCSRSRYALFATKRRQPYQPGISPYGYQTRPNKRWIK